MSLTIQDIIANKEALLDQYQIAVDEEQEEFQNILQELYEKLVHSPQRDTVTRRVFKKMSDITDALAKGEDLDTVLRIIIKGVLAVFPKPKLAASICGFDDSRPEKYQFVHETYILDGEDKVQRRFMSTPSRNGYKMNPVDNKLYLGTAMTAMNRQQTLQPQQRPVYIKDVIRNWPSWMPSLRNPLDPQLASTAYLPLIVGSKRVGIITLQFSKSHTFTKDEKAELYLYAKMAASALYDTQLQQERTKRLENIEMLQKIRRESLASSVNLQMLAERAANFVLQFNFNNFILYMEDGTGTFLGTRDDSIHLQPVTLTSLPYSRFWLSADFWKTHKQSKLEDPIRENWQWALGYPLKTANQNLGLFFVTRSQEEADKILGWEKGQEREDDVYPFLATEREFLELLAEELSLLVDDMYGKQRLANKLQVIAEVANVISDHPSMPFTELVHLVATHLGKIFSNEHFQILSCEKGQILYLKVFREGVLEDGTIYEPYEKGSQKDLAEYVLDIGETVFIPNDLRDYIRRRTLNIKLNPRMPSSYIGVPIKKMSHVYGVIEVEGPTDKNTLWDSDRAVVEALAALIGRDWEDKSE